MSQMGNTGADVSAPLVLGPMKAPDVFRILRILKILGFDSLSGLIDAKTQKDLSFKPPQMLDKDGRFTGLPRDKWTESQILAETRYQTALSRVMLNFIGVLLDRFGDPNLEAAVYDLLAAGAGVTAGDIKSMDAGAFLDLVDRYVTREEFGDFFTQAWRLLTRSESTASPISSIGGTLIRSV